MPYLVYILTIWDILNILLLKLGEGFIAIKQKPLVIKLLIILKLENSPEIYTLKVEKDFFSESITRQNGVKLHMTIFTPQDS